MTTKRAGDGISRSGREKKAGRGHYSRENARKRQGVKPAQAIQAAAAERAIEAAGLLFQDVAHALGITKTTLLRKRTGKTAFLIPELVAIQHLTGVDLGARIAGMAPLPGAAIRAGQPTYWDALADAADLHMVQARRLREAVRTRTRIHLVDDLDMDSTDDAGESVERTPPDVSEQHVVAEVTERNTVTGPSPAAIKRAEESRRQEGAKRQPNRTQS